VRLFAWAILAAVLSAGRLRAEVVHLRDYQPSEPHDRGVLFAMAVTPEQDVLSLVAKESGKWRLSRIRGWLDKKPGEQTIDVPGLSRKDFAQSFPPWFASLFVTVDGNFAVCISSGDGTRADGRRGVDDIVSVVDLREFRVLTTIHADDGGFYLDRMQRLVLETSKSFPRVAGQDALRGGNDVKLTVMDLPTLRVVGQCQFKEWMSSGTVERREGEESCDGLLAPGSGGRVSVATYLDRLEDSYGFPRKRTPSPPCPVVATRDGKFELEFCQNFHKNFWGNPVVTDNRVNIRSLKAGSVATVNLTSRDSVTTKLAYQSGRDFLLVVEGGTKLKVYELE
jgi:hypothetical protein